MAKFKLATIIYSFLKCSRIILLLLLITTTTEDEVTADHHKGDISHTDHNAPSNLAQLSVRSGVMLGKVY